MKRLHVWMSGNVQGVGFRYFLRNKAIRFGVSGFVKNLKDGRVEAVFEGDESSLEIMLGFCRRGTFVSKVNDMDIKKEIAKQEYKEFEIKT